MLRKESATLKFSISGLRGIYPADINVTDMAEFTRAFHQSVMPGGIAIARDARPTGEALLKIVGGTLQALGRSVFDLGLVPTPTIKAFVKKHKLAGGLMVSASHNPVDYTALKFIGKDGFFFSYDDNRKWVNQLDGQPHWGSPYKPGSVQLLTGQANAEHIAECIHASGIKKGFKGKIALDPVGSCAMDISRDFLQKVGISFVAIHTQEEKNFPRPPEPVPSALKKLCSLVKDKKCALGFAFDPDADRLALVNEHGKAIGEEYTLPLALMNALHTRKGPVVANLSSSYLNRYVAEKFGRKYYMSAVGEANVVSLMREKKAAFGGEGNGGVIDPLLSSYGRDSIAGMSHILSLLQREKKTVSQIVDSLPHTTMIKIAKRNVDTGLLDQWVNILRQKYTDFIPTTIDGFHLSHPRGLPWIHLRASNTEPVVRIIAEAESQSALDNLIHLPGLAD